MSLHLLQIQVERSALARFAHSQRSLRHRDEGQGYALHAWLQALFGSAAPKPFRWLEAKGQLLGYSASDAATLLAQAKAMAEPLALAGLLPDGMASRPMPLRWQAGQGLRFEVLACPVERHGKQEFDAYRDVNGEAHGGVSEPERDRETVYRHWLERQCAHALNFDELRLEGWHLATLLRRTQGQREPRGVRRPLALYRGLARVREGEAFAQLLARGVGRHRAFGLGCLLLAPP